MLNALIHRDYSIYTEGTPIQIDFFSDRLEIHSPGSLYGRMSVEDLGLAHPNARNPVLAVMTESLTDAEHRYSGIPTMRRAMQEAGLPAPVFINRQNEFVVVLYNSPAEASQPPVSGSEKTVLRRCCNSAAHRARARKLQSSSASQINRPAVSRRSRLYRSKGKFCSERSRVLTNF